MQKRIAKICIDTHACQAGIMVVQQACLLFRPHRRVRQLTCLRHTWHSRRLRLSQQTALNIIFVEGSISNFNFGCPKCSANSEISLQIYEILCRRVTPKSFSVNEHNGFGVTQVAPSFSIHPRSWRARPRGSHDSLSMAAITPFAPLRVTRSGSSSANSPVFREREDQICW